MNTDSCSDVRTTAIPTRFGRKALTCLDCQAGDDFATRSNQLERPSESWRSTLPSRRMFYPFFQFKSIGNWHRVCHLTSTGGRLFTHRHNN